MKTASNLETDSLALFISFAKLTHGSYSPHKV